MDWVEKAHNALSSDKEIVAKSFEVCGITTIDPKKVRSGEFYEQCMSKAKTLLENEPAEDDDNPFDL